MNLIALSIPGFFLLMGLELWASRRRGVEVYRFSDSAADLGCGIVQQVLVVFYAPLTVLAYQALYEHRAFELPVDAAWVWILAFLGVDLCYYWFHRASHEVNLLWAAHVVHHQSEEYNLSVALRQAAFQPVFSWVFYLPLALLGVQPAVFFTLAALNTLYQFWIHTRLIGRLGPLEWILNTPSHHRVHHGQNPIYIDRNHGGTLILWDRLFGTFQAETEPVIYGVTEPVSSWSPIWANLHSWVVTARRTRAAQSLREAAMLWLGRPGRAPAGAEAVPKFCGDKYDPPAPLALKRYVGAHFALASAGTTLYLFLSTAQWTERLTLGALIVLAMTTLGGLLEARRWAAPAERARLVLAPVAVALLLPHPAALAAAVLVAAGSLWALGRCRGTDATDEAPRPIG